MSADGVVAAEGGVTVPWDSLQNGYRQLYDPRPALARVAAGGDWDELWQELHHQGDVDTASYAALPLMADLAEASHGTDWNLYALAATIEAARVSDRNPQLPGWAGATYANAWRRLFNVGLVALAVSEDELLTTSILAVVALQKKLPLLARFTMLSEQERAEALAEIGWG